MPDPARMSRIAILAALKAEYRAIRNAIGRRDDVDVQLIGLRATHMAPLKPGTGLVIVAGLAGALDPSLKVGDLVLDLPRETGASAHGYHVPRIPSRWRRGTVYSADGLVATVQDKANLFRQTSALVVDMEQAAVHRAVPNDVQVIGLRAVSDTADMALDPTVIHLIDSRGRPRPLKAISMLIRRPGLAAHLRQLSKNAQIALDHLSLAIKVLLEGLDRFPSNAGVAYAPPPDRL
jgi:adenosylhomocysteine nucleosidase